MGGELQRLSLAPELRTGARLSIFRTYDRDGMRYYLLSQCRPSSVYPTAIPGYNNNWYATQDTGIFSGFHLGNINPIYYRYVNAGMLIGRVDTSYLGLPINYGAGNQCVRNY